MGIEDASAGDYDALVIPGGYSPDKIRVNSKMVQFTRQMHDEGKPVAAICHAGWMLSTAGYTEPNKGVRVVAAYPISCSAS